MNILFVNKVSPRFGGGAEVRLLEIGKRLVMRGHTVHVICAKTQLGLPNLELINGIQVHYLHLIPESLFCFERFSFYFSRYVFYPATFFLDRKIRLISPDIIVDYVAPIPSLVYLVARRLRVPCCVEVQGYYGEQLYQALDPLTATLGLIGQFLLQHFEYDGTITISHSLKSELAKKHSLHGSIAVVPYGVTLDRYKINPLPERKPCVLVLIARLVKFKGHRYLFDSLAQVFQRRPDVQLYVIGSGPERVQLEDYVRKLGIEKQVRFLGPVYEDREKAWLLWESTIFVMPSLMEGFGLVLLEALACGLPIVAFDLPVYREFIDDECGYLVPLKDTRAMAERILFLLQNRDVWERMSAHNLQYIQQFNWDRFAEMEEQVLVELVGV